MAGDRRVFSVGGGLIAVMCASKAEKFLLVLKN